ncbi:MAG: pentapeptide repeat-containing protein [Spirochaetaceae bacterium]|nr:pentapeptide repeat-containing protein [Spirochaetaceae bacterium]
MNDWTLSCVALTMVLCSGTAFSQEQDDAPACIDQAGAFVEAHKQWLTNKGVYVNGEFLGLLVEGSFSLSRLLDLSEDDPRDDRPTLCKDLAGPDGAVIGRIDLKNETLAFANLKNAVLNGAILEGTNLFGATLTNAKLRHANLRNANLNQTRVDGAILADADLRGSVYTPNPSTPPSSDIANIKGVAQLRIEEGSNEAGVVQLRKIFKELGLRDHERQATYAIEKYRAHTGDLFGPVQRIAIGLPTGWGLWPTGAWAGIAIFMGVGTMCYTVAILIQRKRMWWCRGGIYRVHLADHLSPEGPGMRIGDRSRVDHLRPRHPLFAVSWAFYFALLSCFHIGWRGLNVGLWVARVQTKEFALRGYGWVRIISGFQSLLSVYLLALWTLTYFGRPFG